MVPTHREQTQAAVSSGILKDESEHLWEGVGGWEGLLPISQPCVCIQAFMCF